MGLGVRVGVGTDCCQPLPITHRRARAGASAHLFSTLFVEAINVHTHKLPGDVSRGDQRPGMQAAIIFMSKRILFFASDPVEREAIQTELCASEEGWEKQMAGTFDEAVAALEPDAFDAIVVAHHEDKSSAKLLNWAAEHHPRIARLIMAEPEKREDVLRVVLATHQFLAKPVTPAVLVGTIESALLLSGSLPNEVLLTLAASIKVFPPMPSLYFKVMAELKSPDYSAQTVAEILAKDLAMTTRLLQVINSGLYGLPRRITDLTEVVNLLGQEAVKSLVIGIHVFLQHDHIKPLYFSISQIWQHSTAVATGARLITQMETGSSERAAEAYTAGLLHDIGKLVLANNFEAQYNAVQKAARELHQPLWEAEVKEFGVSHAEMGAFILGRWGMPMALLEATAWHHQPGRSSSQEFTALTAVHISNALVHELHGSKESGSPSTLDLFHIEALGLTHRIDAWKECLRSGKPQPQGKPSPKQSTASAASGSPANRAPTRAQPQRTAPTRPARAASKANRWLAVAASAAVIGMLIWFFRDEWGGRKASWKPVKSRPVASESAEAVSGDTEMNSDATTETNTVPAPVEPTAPAVVTEPPPAEPSKPEEPAAPKDRPLE